MGKKCKVIIFLAVFFSATLCIYPSDKNRVPLTFGLTPGGLIPLGKSADLYKLGFGLELSGEYSIPGKPQFFLSGNLGYSHPPTRADSGLSIFSIGAGSGVNYQITPKLFGKGYIQAGGYYASLFEESEFGKSSALNPYAAAGTGLYYKINSNLSAGAQVSYRYYFGIYNALGFSLGTMYQFGGRKRGLEQQYRLTPLTGNHLEIVNIEFDDVFPVFFKYYDDQAIGKALLRNREKFPLTDIKVQLLVKQYMDSPKECGAPSMLKEGEEQFIDLRALFTDRVLSITEGNKVAAEITVQYKYKEQLYTNTKVSTLSLYDRNATRWDDDRKAAAFVTAKDPAVLRFSKSVAGVVKEKGSKSVNENLRVAMAIHESIHLLGVNYVIDPTTPYTEFSKNEQAVDYLQFPRQTLDYRAGDCDDLSILYTALLESVGIETAFITTPGHIYIAFNAGVSPRLAHEQFSKQEDLIYKRDGTWIPVEVTATEEGFIKAWELGAKLWREASAKGDARFYPVREAWKVYNPVGLPGEAELIELPSEEMIAKSYLQELSKYINQEIYPQVAQLENEIRRHGESPVLRNKLGVLYARYGLIEMAQKEFIRVLKEDDSYVPALLNMGNIYFLQNNMKQAQKYYTLAAEQKPDDPKTLLCIARVNHELENYGTVRELYQKLKAMDPDLASRFAYLDLRGEEALRAAEAAREKEVMVWVD